MQPTTNSLTIGYVHIFVESITVKESKGPIHAKVSLGELAKAETSAKQSGSNWNEPILMQIPKDPSRLLFDIHEGENRIGECRYDLNPFFEHPTHAHSIESQLFNDENEAQGTIKLKLTYYSQQNGKLKVRVFQLDLAKPFVEKFKQAKIKVRFGIFAQSTPILKLDDKIDEEVQLIILNINSALTFEVVHTDGLICSYTISKFEEEGYLKEEAKAYQVSVFNNDKAIGTIKYQLQWVKKK